MNRYDVETMRLGYQRELMLARADRDALAAALENVRDCLAHTGGDIGAAAALRAARAALAQVQPS